ncbi:MAG: hypothetical protein IPK79_03100 [Vampirovibrionales bacterium]|nr:hypothetical protein [Vampirovibrionales bacterium]
MTVNNATTYRAIVGPPRAFYNKETGKGDVARYLEGLQRSGQAYSAQYGRDMVVITLKNPIKNKAN